ncbi:hypothetical protein HID58_002002, partial [Brassica napus]
KPYLCIMTIMLYPTREQAWAHHFFHFYLSRKLNSFHLLSNSNKFHLLSNSNKATKNKYLERVNLWQNCVQKVVVSGVRMPISDGKAKASREICANGVIDQSFKARHCLLCHRIRPLTWIRLQQDSQSHPFGTNHLFPYTYAQSC